MTFTPTLAFGPLLKQLRKQAGMTQRDLAAALGYSESLISCLEKAQRQPDLQAVTTSFIPALGLQDDPNTAAALIEQAALARGERPPASVTFQRTTRLSVQAEPVQALSSPPTELIGRAVEVTQLCNRLLFVVAEGRRGQLLVDVIEDVGLDFRLSLFFLSPAFQWSDEPAYRVQQALTRQLHSLAVCLAQIVLLQ